jgi:hypothetical protein
MAKGTITLSGSTVGTKMESLEVEQGATGGVNGLLKVDNNDTDKQAFTIEASNIDEHVMDIQADAVTTARVLKMSADALTSGAALYIDSDSSSTGTRDIVFIAQNHASATGSTALYVQSDAGKGITIDSNLAAGGPSLEIDAEQTTTNCVSINSDPSTTGTTIDISADGKTTGGVLKIDSDSSSTSTRNLVEIIQNHSSATGSTALTLQSDAGRGLFIDANLAAGGPSLEIDSEKTTTNCVSINSDPSTTGTVIDISADGLTTGGALKIDSDSSSTSTRSLVEIIQNHASATGATALKVQQDSSGDAAVFQGGNIRVTKGGSAFQTSLHHAWVMGS